MVYPSIFNMKKNTIIITGGAGFVGSNLINLFINRTKFKIISLDNYSTGSTKNHIRNKRIKSISISGVLLPLMLLHNNFESVKGTILLCLLW